MNNHSKNNIFLKIIGIIKKNRHVILLIKTVIVPSQTLSFYYCLFKKMYNLERQEEGKDEIYLPS